MKPTSGRPMLTSYRFLLSIGRILSCLVLVACSRVLLASDASRPLDDRSFELETIVDFPDDVTSAERPLVPEDIDALMASLARLGIRRVSWAYYGDGIGGFLNPTDYREEYQGNWANYSAAYASYNPLKVAVDAGHRHGLEVYAYFKPYETGPAYAFPEGSPEARRWGLLEHKGGKLPWLHPFVRDHPELRIKRLSDQVSGMPDDVEICSIRLIKSDALPTRIRKENLEIWTSTDNFRYGREVQSFSLAETVEVAGKDFCDARGNVLTRRGSEVRVLTLEGLSLRQKYILVTTNFREGTPDFANSGLELMRALDARGLEIPGVFANGGAIAFMNLNNFRSGGLMFDHGRGATVVRLDASNQDGRSGLIAYTRGRNEYLAGALCETEPAVQRFWLTCLEDMLQAGVDGIDFRDENHSTHTDHPDEYGFNEVVLKHAAMLPGRLVENVARVRGDAYTEFLAACSRRLRAAGVKMRYNLQLDYLRPSPPVDRFLAYPRNVEFQWRRWLEDDLFDSVIARTFALPHSSLYDDQLALEIIEAFRAKGKPITVNRYIGARHAGENLLAELKRVRDDGRFAGFIFYEVYDFISFGRAPGQCRVTSPLVEAAWSHVR